MEREWNCRISVCLDNPEADIQRVSFHKIGKESATTSRVSAADFRKMGEGHEELMRPFKQTFLTARGEPRQPQRIVLNFDRGKPPLLRGGGKGQRQGRDDGQTYQQ